MLSKSVLTAHYTPHRNSSDTRTPVSLAKNQLPPTARVLYRSVRNTSLKLVFISSRRLLMLSTNTLNNLLLLMLSTNTLNNLLLLMLSTNTLNNLLLLMLSTNTLNNLLLLMLSTNTLNNLLLFGSFFSKRIK